MPARVSLYCGLSQLIGVAALILAGVSAQAAETSVSATASLNPSIYGQSVKFTATAAGFGGGAPTGSLSFKSGSTEFGTATLNAIAVNQQVIAAGHEHTCALSRSGGVKCWGRNTHGQLGVATENGTDNATPIPVDVPGLDSGVTALAAGQAHTCALTSAGGVKCWGVNNQGQLGASVNSGTENANPVPVDVDGLTSGVVAVSAGQFHTCALTSSGGVKCWGWNFYGQIGGTLNNGVNSPNPVPVDVPELSSGVAVVRAGGSHTCAVTAAGGIKCWGRNNEGQLGNADGNGTTDPAPTPLDVAGLQSGIRDVAAGVSFTCSLSIAGEVRCWGSNVFGQVGVNAAAPAWEPRHVWVLSGGITGGVSMLSAGGSHVCATEAASGEMKCWGYNYYGQQGHTTNNTSSSPNPSPRNVVGQPSQVVAMSGGGVHTCVLTQVGSVFCCGNNFFGQIGISTNNGTGNPNPTPVTVSDFGTGEALVYAQAAFTTAALSGGSHSITVGYAGDAAHNGSTSDPLTQTVNKASTSISVSSGGTPSQYNQSIVITGTITSSAGTTPAGTISFYDNGTLIGSDPVGVAGAGTFSSDALTIGTHPITAVYGGDGNFNGSTSTVFNQTIIKADTTTTLSLSPTSVIIGNSSTATVTLSNTLTTGAVEIKDNATLLCTVTLAAGGGSCDFEDLVVGTRTITAVYGGDGNFNGSTSAGQSLTVLKASSTTTSPPAPTRR